MTDMATTSPERELTTLAAAPPEVVLNNAADVGHIMAHAGVDEATGTWTGGACPRLGRPLGSEVHPADLDVMHHSGAGLTDVCWYAPEGLAGVYRVLLDACEADAVRAVHEQDLGRWQDRISAVWSYAWSANCTFLAEVVQATAFSRGSDGLLIASYEHNSSEHGRVRPHVHNLIVRRD